MFNLTLCRSYNTILKGNFEQGKPPVYTVSFGLNLNKYCSCAIQIARVRQTESERFLEEVLG